jgi:hypothetical protein
MKRAFFTQFAAFAFACFTVVAGLKAAFGPAIVHPLAFHLLAGFLALTLFSYRLMARFIGQSVNVFFLIYFSKVAVRVILSLGIVLAYLLRRGVHSRQDVLTFLGAFFTLYFLCTGFEIWAIFSNLRPFSVKQVSEA